MYTKTKLWSVIEPLWCNCDHCLLQRIERKLQEAQARQKRTNRLTPSDLQHLVDASLPLASAQACRTAPSVQRSSWDHGLSGQAQSRLLTFAVTAREAAQGPIESMWHPCRGKGNRLSLLPAVSGHKLHVHATALLYSTEQAAATCAAAAAATAWNVCCAPLNGCDIALAQKEESATGMSQAEQSNLQPHVCAEASAHPMTARAHFMTAGNHPLISRPLMNSMHADLSAHIPTEQAVPRVATEGNEGALGAEAPCDVASLAQQQSWPLLEKDVLAVYAEQERGKVTYCSVCMKRIKMSTFNM